MKISDQFVTYKISLKLKELGFNELCFGYFNCKGNLKISDCSKSINDIPFYYKNSECEVWLSSLFSSKKVRSKICVAPLWQQAIDWILQKLESTNMEPNRKWSISYYANGDGYIYFDEGDCWFRFNNLEQMVLKGIELYENKMKKI